MSEFLTQDEIAELTGKKRAAAQIAWLHKNGWIFIINAANRPIIGRQYARGKLGGTTYQPQFIGGQPNFAALMT